MYDEVFVVIPIPRRNNTDKTMFRNKYIILLSWIRMLCDDGSQLLYSLFTTHGKRSVKQERFWIIRSSRIGPVLHSPKESPLHELVSFPMHLYGFGVRERGYIVAQFFTIPAVITIKAEG